MYRVAVVALVLALAAPAVAAIVPDPEGVYIDADGVLRTHRVEGGSRLRELREAARRRAEEAGLAYVSLPRLFAEARARIESGEALTDEMKYLSGLVGVRHVFVFPEEGDVVIAGPAEPIVADFPGRPVGGVTGRPLLQLDDLVVALRTCGPGRAGTAFGCTIQLSQEAVDRMFARMRERRDVVRDEPDRRREVADEMAAAAGLQPVAFFNLAEDTRFAFVAAEADYQLKRHALGLDASPVRAVNSYIGRLTRPSPMTHRFWFELNYGPLGVTPEGDAFEIRGSALKVCTRRSFEQEDPEPDEIARAYAEDMTRHFEDLAEAYPSFADLANLADLSLVAALLDREGIPARIGWDLEWWLAEYPVARVETASQAAALANFRVAAGTVHFAGGGVRFRPSDFVDDREEDATGALRGARRRPGDHGWSETDR